MIKKILIANRGEIALRIQRTARKMGINTVIVYATADKNAAFVKQADEAELLQGTQLSETYLNISQILAVAKKTNADAIHPGYGFLSENAVFAETCKKEGILFIGPDAGAMKAMGNKIAARETAVKVGIPVTPGITGTVAELLSNYKTVGFPLLIKAATGGGGKGMHIVNNESELQKALEATAREAKSYFGDSSIYIEKYIAQPRHIEVQIIGDQHGNVLHLLERECSLQRRHQKIVEEAASPSIPRDVREKICTAAVNLAQSIGYFSAGTMEFLLAEDLSFFFLEMNTRIQVEHPVTELITGIDIVALQIKIACGEKLSIRQNHVQQNGHAIECRIYAEDPEHHFLPSPGTIQYYNEPLSFKKHPHASILRIDGMGLQTGDTISGDFDPMISKLTIWAPTREQARMDMLSALSRYHIKGIKTNIHFLKGLLRHPNYINNTISTKYIDNHLSDILHFIKEEKKSTPIAIPLAATIIKSLRKSNTYNDSIWHNIGYWRHNKTMRLQIDETPVEITLTQKSNSEIIFELHNTSYYTTLETTEGINQQLNINRDIHEVSIYESKPGTYEVTTKDADYIISRCDISVVDYETFERKDANGGSHENITSPMPGKVIKVNVQKGDKVRKGDVLLIVEAMKMENNIISPIDATVESINVAQGDKVDTSTRLIQLLTESDSE